MAAPYLLSMCNDSQWVRIVDAPKCIFNVPQSGRNTTRQLSLPDSPAFLCRLFEFIDFAIQMLDRITSAEAAIGNVSLILAGYRAPECRMAGCS